MFDVHQPSGFQEESELNGNKSLMAYQVAKVYSGQMTKVIDVASLLGQCKAYPTVDAADWAAFLLANEHVLEPARASSTLKLLLGRLARGPTVGGEPDFSQRRPQLLFWRHNLCWKKKQTQIFT